MPHFITTNTRLHRRTLVATGILGLGLAVSAAGAGPAHAAAATTVEFYVSAPGIEGPPSLPGMTIETFDSYAHGTRTSTSSPELAIGNITSGGLAVEANNPWAGAVRSDTTPVPSDFTLPATNPNPNYPGSDKTTFAYPSNSVTITLTQPANYLGLYWAAGSEGNTLKLRSGSTVIATFNSTDLMRLLPTTTTTGQTITANGGAVYQVDHYKGGHKDSWDSWRNPPTWNPQPFAFIHAVVPLGATFDSVELVTPQFEFDNLAVATYTGNFDATGLVGVPLSNQASQPVLVPTVTFNSNDGTSTSVTQSMTKGSTAALRANTFTRAGYTFAGWHTTASGVDGVSYADGADFTFSSDLTLYAQWTAIATTTTSTTTPPTSTTTPPVQRARTAAKNTGATDLPETGSDFGGMSTAALVLCGAGLVLMVRRRLI